MIDQAAYMAHGYCLLWKPWLIAIHAGSDVMIFGAYFAIPVAIWMFIRKRNDLTLKPLAILFAAFIFLCGITHAIQGLTLWWPIYETQGVVKLITAIVSVTTAIAIFPLVPKALAIPSPSQLQIVNNGLALEIAAHRQTLAELERAKDELEIRVAERTRELAHSNARFAALVQASAQVVWTATADGEVVEDSPSWRALTGQTFDEWKGNGWINAIHPEDRARTLAAWQDAIRTRQMYAVEYRVRHGQSGWLWTAAKSVPLLENNGELREWVGMNSDIDARKRAEEHMKFVMQELSHRTKNLLAVVFAMTQQAAKLGGGGPEFIRDFSARIQGLSRSHDILVNSNWTGAPLDEHIRSQIQPFAPFDNRRVDISGPPVMLRSEATQALGLAFHELATNAAKYGALARPEGKIEIGWTIEKAEDEEFLRLWWREPNRGPDVQQPSREGFGSFILNRVVPESLAGAAQIRFSDHEVVWEIKAPLREVEPSLEQRSATIVHAS